MVTRNVVITDHQAKFLERLVAEGRYQNVSEAMREGLRGLEERETEFERQRDGILEALAQVERGEVAEGTLDEIFDRAWDGAMKRNGKKA